MDREFWSRDPKSIQNAPEENPKYDRQFSILRGQVKRIKRVSILSLLLIVLATIVHIVQFFVPPAKINQQYAKIVEGNRAAVHSAPEYTRPEEILTSTRVLNGDEDAVFTGDIPLGRGFVKQKDEHGTDQIYAVAAIHQLRCVYFILNSFSLALDNVTALDSVQQRTTYHCIEILRQAVRCQADPTLDITYPLPDDPDTPASLGWGTEHICRNYDKLFEWSEKNRADDSTGLGVVYGYAAQ
ncbi:hypothetical protein Daus18300_011654 [Diaporthe australafricana]|uniref:Tat pathway signal sequence n=1 Tax=Diaporthe australafricana TaxID=127596 RepID=A0ABR3W5Q0_9PEZI